MVRKSLIILIAVITLLFLSIVSHTARAAEITATWAYNSIDTTTSGFKFYLDGEVVQDVQDPITRSSSFIVDLSDGKHLFSMTAYGEKEGTPWETDHSPEFPFEYINIKNTERTPPTVFIRVN